MDKPEALIVGIGSKEKPMDNKNEICLPAAALAVQDDQGSTPPAEGDMVEFSTAGKVSRVERDNVYVKIEKVNGQSIEGSDEEESSESPEEEDKEASGLRGQAQDADKNDMGY